MRSGFLDLSRRIHGILWSLARVRETPERKAFSYNKRTMDRAMGVVAVPRINNLRAVNTLNSPTPAASTKLNHLLSIDYSMT